MHPPQVMGTPNAVFDVFDAHADAQYVSLNVPCTGLFAVKAALTLHDLVHLPPPPSSLLLPLPMSLLYTPSVDNS